MAEWSNARASKACMPQGIGGSNPPLSGFYSRERRVRRERAAATKAEKQQPIWRVRRANARPGVGQTK